SKMDAAPPTADARKSTGKILRAACHAGTAVLAISTAVYPASGAPKTPAPSAAPSPRARAGEPDQVPATARDPSAPVPARSHVPKFIGDVGRKTRIMLRNREGLPRSAMRSTDPAA